MIKPVDITPIPTLVDFRSGPFSDDKIYSSPKRRVICQQLLRRLLAYPETNAANIITVNEAMKGLI